MCGTVGALPPPAPMTERQANPSHLRSPGCCRLDPAGPQLRRVPLRSGQVCTRRRAQPARGPTLPLAHSHRNSAARAASGSSSCYRRRRRRQHWRRQGMSNRAERRAIQSQQRNQKALSQMAPERTCELVLVRHGETAYNAEERLQACRRLGWGCRVACSFPFTPLLETAWPVSPPKTGPDAAWTGPDGARPPPGTLQWAWVQMCAA